MTIHLSESEARRRISFTCYCKPQPQGSSRAFIPKGWKRPVITSDNPGLKSFRQEVSQSALVARQQAGSNDLIFGKHEAVEIKLAFYFQRPPSIPKKRDRHVVKPDLSKLIRAAEDSLTGIIFNDDAQIVKIESEKHYGQPERVEIVVHGVDAT